MAEKNKLSIISMSGEFDKEIAVLECIVVCAHQAALAGTYSANP